MKRTAISAIFLFLFFSIGSMKAQDLSARVLESVFFVYPNGGGQGMISRFDLDSDSLFTVMESKVQEILNLQSISSAQPAPFIFSRRKKKYYKAMGSADQMLAQNQPADLYLLFLLTVDPPYPSMMTNHLVKTAVTFDVFIFDRNYQLTERIRGRKRSTGLSSDSGEDGEDLDLSFFDLDRESFLFLFDKAVSRLGKGD
ncbi:hypothetical protein [Algoriphagus confluentis]|uniref:Uncharacterized protein n=1 Tax=Algoriphagus confluentis TaxID=1697556 RepID=A0ABQ6PRB5_9BACT|nr:hypothetical protein Aconfl_29160 [Algoriphagus confluentis]